jgi:hypothetical protein
MGKKSRKTTAPKMSPKNKTGFHMIDAVTTNVPTTCLFQKQTCTTPTLLKPGKYFIGDLGSAMSENDIDEATKCRFAASRAGNYSHRFGKYTLPNGRELLIFGTTQGDGPFRGHQQFTDSDGHVYAINTCAIGITLVEGMPTEFLGMGRIVDFEQEFICAATTLDETQLGKLNWNMITFGTKLEFFWEWCNDCKKAAVPTDMDEIIHLQTKGPCKSCGV